MKTKLTALFVTVLVTLLLSITSPGRLGSVRTDAAARQGGAAVLSVASGFGTQPDPLAGRHPVLFKQSFGEFLRRQGMFQGPPGTRVTASPLKVWAESCKMQSPACQQALYDMRPNTVAEGLMAANGKTTLPGVPPGTYYLFAVALYDRQFLVWDLRVDLKPGANLVTLDRRNTAVPETNSTQANAPSSETKPCQVTDALRPQKPGVRADSILSVRGGGYIYTYTRTNRRTGQVEDSFTERGNFSNTTLYLLDEDAETILERAGVQPGLLGSRVANLTLIDAGTQLQNVPGIGLVAAITGHSDAPGEVAKLAKADYDCAMKWIQAHSAAAMTTDTTARGVFPRVPAGTYYLYGRFYRVTKPVRGGGMVWNMKVILTPGPNALTLTVDNAAYK